MNRKWKNVSELCLYICKDDTLDTCCIKEGKKLKCVCYAPHIGYFIWIFKYYGTYVALADMGNGHYDLYSAVSRFDVLRAKLTELWDRINYRIYLKKGGIYGGRRFDN